MTDSELTEVVRKRLKTIEDLMVIKAAEYAGGDPDRLQNFKKGAALNNSLPEVYLWNLVSKHIIALKDFIYGRPATMEQWLEKIGDIINYMVLLEALITERETHKVRAQRERSN